MTDYGRKRNGRNGQESGTAAYGNADVDGRHSAAPPSTTTIGERGAIELMLFLSLPTQRAKNRAGLQLQTESGEHDACAHHSVRWLSGRSSWQQKAISERQRLLVRVARVLRTSRFAKQFCHVHDILHRMYKKPERHRLYVCRR